MLCNFTAAPQLTEKPQDVQKTIDDTLVWECKASAKPKASYRWLKNGEPLDHVEVREAVNHIIMMSWIQCCCVISCVLVFDFVVYILVFIAS